MPSKKIPVNPESRIAELERKLAELQACLDLFSVAAPAGLGIFDRDCRYSRLNQTLADFAEHSIAEHIGKKPSDLLPPQLATQIETLVRETLTTGKPDLNRRFTCAMPIGSGTPRHWLASHTPLRTSGGEITGVGMVVVEETGLQQLRQSLNQHEILHQALLESIPARIFMKDCAGNYLYCNNVFAADVGLAKAEIMGKNDFDIFRPEMAEKYRQADLQVISSGQVNDFEHQFKKNSRTYFIHVCKTPFRDPEGNICGILGIFQDLTEQRQAERQARIAGHALRETLAGVAISDPAGVLNYVNPAFVRMWGYANDQEIIGRSASEFWTNPSAAEEVINNIYTKGLWQGEMTGLRKDGAAFSALLAANLVTDQVSQPLCMIGSFIDITARKEAEGMLREGEEKLRQITDHIDEAVWIMDTTDGKLLYVSPACEIICGHTREDLYCDPEVWLETVHPQDREGVISTLRQIGRERKLSYRLLRPDGTFRQVFSRIFPVLDNEGRVYREVGIIQDVSKMKEAEAKLLAFSRRLSNAVEEERSAIARDLHDEFGQTLVRLRQWQKAMNEALPPALETLVDNDDFDEIVNLLGSIIRRTTHRLRPDILDNLGLAAAIEREVKDFGHRFKSVEATFRVIGKSRPLDSEHALVFYRVLQEAMTNSARHALAKRLEVRLIFSFPTIILTVEDDGVGFDPAAYKSLNEESCRLGLRGIVERMATIGGRARITSSPGRGTTIRAELNLDLCSKITVTSKMTCSSAPAKED